MVSLHTETVRFKWPGHKNELCFFRNTLLTSLGLMKNSRSFFYDSPSVLTRGKEPRVIYFSSWGSRRSRRYYIFFYIFRKTKFSRNYDTLQWYFGTSHHPRVNFGEWLIIFALKWTLLAIFFVWSCCLFDHQQCNTKKPFLHTIQRKFDSLS